MPARSEMTLFVLSCLHTVMYAPPLPRTGDKVTCIKCHKPVTVAKVPSRYEVRCSVSGCKRANRDYGNAYVTAETKAIKHATSHVGHEVTVFEDGVVRSRHKREAVALDMPNF